MPRRKNSPVRAAITSVISPQRIRALSRLLGVVKRQRKIDVVALVASLTMGFGTGRQRTIAVLRRAYERSTGQTLAPSSFYARLTAPLVLLLKALTEEAMTKIDASAPRLRHSLARFTQVLVADGSLLRLHAALARHYRPVWKNYIKAAAKLHVVVNVSGRSAQSVHITHGSRQDVRILKVGEWLRGKLLILDLGYSKGLLFLRIQQYGGFFLLRKKGNMDPRITVGPKQLIGSRLSEVASKLKGQTVDLQGLIPWYFDRGPHKCRRHELSVRIVGNWHAEEHAYRFYITNAPPDILAAADTAAVYAARWEVELFFRELKRQHHIEDLPSSKRSAVECLIYAAILTLLISRRLRQLLFSPKHPVAIERWAAIFSSYAREMLTLFLAPYSSLTEHRLVKALKHESFDPNRKRRPLVLRAQMGSLAPS